jgi:hypothetical protein
LLTFETNKGEKRVAYNCKPQAFALLYEVSELLGSFILHIKKKDNEKADRDKLQAISLKLQAFFLNAGEFLQLYQNQKKLTFTGNCLWLIVNSQQLLFSHFLLKPNPFAYRNFRI